MKVDGVFFFIRYGILRALGVAFRDFVDICCVDHSDMFECKFLLSCEEFDRRDEDTRDKYAYFIASI